MTEKLTKPEFNLFKKWLQVEGVKLLITDEEVSSLLIWVRWRKTHSKPGRSKLRKKGIAYPPLSTAALESKLLSIRLGQKLCPPRYLSM